MGDIELILLLALAVASSAAFSTAESSLFSLGAVRLRRMKLKRSLAAPLVRSLLARPRRLLITILIGNTFTLTAAAALAATLGSRRDAVYGAGVATALVTVLLFVFAETIPKAVGVSWPEAGAGAMAPFIRLVYWALYPVNRATLALTDYLTAKRPRRNLELAAEDIYGLLLEGERGGVLDDVERGMIEQVVAFADRTAGELATPRTKMFALAAELPFGEAVAAAAAAPFSRIPVYEGDIENIIGVLYVKDILVAAARPPGSLADVCRPVHFVPDSQPAVNLFLDFAKYRTHVAVVVDEYGAVDGLVTMTDVLGEIVGEGPARVRKLTPGRFAVPADIELDEFNDLAGVFLEDEKAETLAGYLMNRTGKVPAVGETYEEAGLRITVTAAEPNRLLELEVEKTERPGE